MTWTPEHKRAMNAKYRRIRKEQGICQRCSLPAATNKRTGLPESLCLKHKLESTEYQHRRRQGADREALLLKQKEWNKNRKISMKCHRFIKTILTALSEPVWTTEYTEDFQPFINKDIE
jgi:hypothetical protein